MTGKLVLSIVCVFLLGSLPAKVTAHENKYAAIARVLKLLQPHDLPQRKAVRETSEFLGKSFVTPIPLAYQTGLPRYDQVTRFIRRNTFTLFAREVDRQITEIENKCAGCLDSDRIVTPIRVVYLPIGSKLKVTGEYLYVEKGLSGSTIHMLIVSDEHGNKSEISEIVFKLSVASEELAGQSALNKDTEILKNISLINQNNKLALSFCPSRFAPDSADPVEFMHDFQMESEVSVKSSTAMCKNGYIIEFKTPEAYLTSRYYFEEWGLFGHWSNNLKRPKRNDIPALKLKPCSIPSEGTTPENFAKRMAEYCGQ